MNRGLGLLSQLLQEGAVLDGKKSRAIGETVTNWNSLIVHDNEALDACVGRDLLDKLFNVILCHFNTFVWVFLLTNLFLLKTNVKLPSPLMETALT